MFDEICRWWCKQMHSNAMWPIHGKYVCRVCKREYPVTWFFNLGEEEVSNSKARQRMPKLSLRQRQHVETL